MKNKASEVIFSWDKFLIFNPDYEKRAQVHWGLNFQVDFFIFELGLKSRKLIIDDYSHEVR